MNKEKILENLKNLKEIHNKKFSIYDYVYNLDEISEKLENICKTSFEVNEVPEKVYENLCNTRHYLMLYKHFFINTIETIEDYINNSH